MNSDNRNRIILVLALTLIIGFVGVQMYYSMTPPRHADHDHAMASLDAGGFLRVEAFEGGRRNLVGKPGRVLILHFFDPMSMRSTEPAQAARFAASVAGDEGIEVLFVARGESWDGIESRASTFGIPTRQLYLDKDGYTGDMLGVRRLPETLIYDPKGLLVHQAKGPLNWSSPGLREQVNRAKAGVAEID